MALHLHSGHAAMSEINVTPLVDVMLVLLVIFLVTAPLLIQTVPVELPKTGAARPVTETRNLAVTINKEGQIFIERQAVAMKDFEKEMRHRQQGGGELNVLIHGDRAAAFGSVAEVMAAVRRAGVTRVGIVTTAQ